MLLTLFIIFALMPVLIFIELTVQQWLFQNHTDTHDGEWEFYRQRYD